jgi:hypothetical protein
MSVSAIGNSGTQQVLKPLVTTSSEARTEGVTPDGDSDRDDVNSVSAASNVNNSAQVSESIGKNINVYA